MRSRAQIDEFVLLAIRERLGRPDLVDTIPSSDEPRLQEIKAQISVHRANVMRAQSDYDDKIIKGHDLKRGRDKEEAKIAALEQERRRLTVNVDLGGVLDATDPVKAFDNADLMIKRRVVDFFMTVTLHPHPRGRKNFDRETVAITPKTMPGATPLS